jgi:hypothetical protein
MSINIFIPLNFCRFLTVVKLKVYLKREFVDDRIGLRKTAKNLIF